MEYKAGWNPDAARRTLCAFAKDFENPGGGCLVIGQGCDAHGQLIQPPCFPALTLEVAEGRHLLVLQAPGGQNAPYKVRLSGVATEVLFKISARFQHHGKHCARPP